MHSPSLKTLFLLADIALCANLPLQSRNPSFTSLDSRGDAAIQGGCNQGTCPDRNNPFDMLLANDFPPLPTRHWMRVNDCGQCIQSNNLGGGGACWDFTSCGRKQNICMDFAKGRAHRIWKDNGAKKCYRIRNETHARCGCGGGLICDVNLWYPGEEVACNW